MFNDVFWIIIIPMENLFQIFQFFIQKIFSWTDNIYTFHKCLQSSSFPGMWGKGVPIQINVMICSFSDCFDWIIEFVSIKTSKKGNTSLFSSSNVNSILLSKPFKSNKMYSTYSIFIKQMVSSTCLFHYFIYVASSGTSDFFNSIIKVSTSAGLKGEPIATPSVCMQFLPVNVTWAFLVHNSNISFNSDIVLVGCNSELS